MRHLAVFFLLAGEGCKPSEGHSLAPSDLELVSAGHEPHRKLRYHAAKSTSRTLEVEVDTDVAAGEMENRMPTIVMTLSVLVEDVMVDGRMKLRTTVRDVVAHQRMFSDVAPAALAAPAEAIEGAVMTSTLYRDGRLVDTVVEGAKPELATLGTSFEQLVMPLPDEPIGVGAIWRSARRVHQGGMNMKAISTITVTGIEGEKVTFTVDTHAFGDDQSVQEAGVSLDVKDIVGTGTGQGSVDLATLATTGSLESEFRSAMTAPGETEPTAMKMRMTTKVMAR